MIGKQRTTPAIVLLAFGTLALFLRQAVVQVNEHELWSEQAARLERSGELIPYRRGAIRDADGRVLVRDVEAYHLDFSYRDFRRSHPLGQTAHAASVILLEPVSLGLALDHAVDWAAAFVELTPGDLREFSRGRGLAIDGGLPGLPATWDLAAGQPRLLGVTRDEDERNDLDLANRSGDLGFYIGGLLELTKQEKKDLLRAADDKRRRDQSYLELVAAERGLVANDLRGELRSRVARSLADLDLLAERMRYPADPRGRTALPLVQELQDWRAAIEDAAARRLFREATGFDPGRVEPGTLFEHFDLRWFAVYLRWDPSRTMAWCHAVRSAWFTKWRGSVALPALVAELRRRGASLDTPTILDSLSTLWYGTGELTLALDGAPRPVDERDGLEVFWALPKILDVDMGPVPRPDDPRLPWSSAMAAAVEGELDPELLVEALGQGAPGTSSFRRKLDTRLEEARQKGNPSSRTEMWAFHLGTPNYRSSEILGELTGELCDAWERGVQELLTRQLEAVEVPAGSDGHLPFREAALERASDRARFVLRDYGMRRTLLDDRPDYEVVQLLTRFPERFPGFGARAARERIAYDRDGHGVPGKLLVGGTAMMDADRAQAQRSDARRLRELRRMGKRTAEQEAELVELVAMVLTADEARGVSGVEGSWDDVLRGYNGYRERVGLEEVEARGADEQDLRPVQHGHDVQLTLDSGLQLVAEEVLEHPVVPEGLMKRDAEWLADPEGAIVVLRPNGELVVAASGPAPWSERVGPERLAVERTLTKPDFKPPGSTFKPFVALYALEQGKIQPGTAYVCLAEASDAGSNMGVYKGVHCHKLFGHSNRYPDPETPPLNVTEALRMSCNVFFAHVGELLSVGDFWQLAHSFGFAEPSGILPEGTSSGLIEHTSAELFSKQLGLRDRMRAANGLSVVEATPVQLARAIAGLATGELPEVRLVNAVEERGFLVELPRPAPEPLPFSAANLEVVRSAMVEVAQHPDGSANDALSTKQVGFRMAVKTGSADLEWRDETTLVKHTWVAGWAPAEDPKVVFVFFVRRTTQTSSWTAIWLARQFFLQPEVRAFLAAEGVPLEDVAIDPAELGRELGR
ncbi:MAG: penicillin-binding transpeptidase domain-containing protein [Planctomycetota bacterium]|nr:penicillin-binding transpeptidase domain-containing protein [Planctomycetota bacterium]